jgi:starvation-inducible outer membrane lipoprotein
MNLKMNLNMWLGALLILLVLSGCTQPPTGQGQAPYPPYSRDNEGMNRGPDM